MSQKDVGKQVGKSKSTISRIESGMLDNISLGLILDIMKVLDVEATQVFTLAFDKRVYSDFEFITSHALRFIKDPEDEGGDTNDDDQ